MLPTCPNEMPPEIMKAAEALALAYTKSQLRPRLEQPVLRHWDKLIDDWSDDESLPLFIRKQRANRGSLVKHLGRGRVLVPCDNSPAHWAVASAFSEGLVVTLNTIRVTYHEIPAAMILTAVESKTAQFKATLLRKHNVNAYGWKLDHIQDVGLNSRAAIERMEMESLKQHFRLLMKPSNIILVPMALKGLGDLPMFLSIVKRSP